MVRFGRNSMVGRIGIGWQIIVVAVLAAIASLFGNMAPAVKQVDISQTDAFQYQVQAVNLVKHHTFPKLNLYGPPESYCIDTLQPMGLSSRMMLERMLHQPPVDDLTKPPVYPLVIAGLYVVFGINPQYVAGLQVFLILFIAIAQVFIAIRLMKFWGVPVGIVSAYIYYSVTIPESASFYPHFLVQFFLLLIFWIGTYNAKPLRPITAAITGVLLALMVLTNGNVIFIPLLLFAYRFVRCFRRGSFASLWVMLSVFTITLAPWILFANGRLASTKTERKEWIEKLWQGSEVKKYNAPLFQNKAQPSTADSLVMEYCIRNIYSKFCTDGYVIVSKQPFGDEVLGAHNEFSHDGNFHPEWRFLTYTYYNTHPSEAGTYVRMAQFYWAYPGAVLDNIVGKFKGTAYPLSPLYFFAGLLLTLLAAWEISGFRYRLLVPFIAALLYAVVPFHIMAPAICLGWLLVTLKIILNKKEGIVPHVFVFAMLNTVFITLLFIGIPRYVQIVDPILLLSVAVVCHRLFLKQVTNGALLLLNFAATHLKLLRIPEVLLMSGYFWVAALTGISGLPEFNERTILLCLAVICYIASVYSLNSYTDYESDKRNPRLFYLSKVSRQYFLYWLIIFACAFVFLSAIGSMRILYLLVCSFFLWVLYYQKPFQLKGRFPGGTIIHFIAGVLHFHVGYEITWGTGFISVMMSLFFASMLSLGHLNHERIDAEADKLEGMGTGSARLSSKTILVLFYLGFVLAQCFWCLLFKWKIIDTALWLSFFQLPVIALIAISPYRNKLVEPYGVQKIFRWLMLWGFVLFGLSKLWS